MYIPAACAPVEVYIADTRHHYVLLNDTYVWFWFMGTSEGQYDTYIERFKMRHEYRLRNEVGRVAMSPYMKQAIKQAEIIDVKSNMLA